METAKISEHEVLTKTPSYIKLDNIGGYGTPMEESGSLQLIVKTFIESGNKWSMTKKDFCTMIFKSFPNDSSYEKYNKNMEISSEQIADICFSEKGQNEIHDELKKHNLISRPFYILRFIKNYLEYDKENDLIKISSLGAYDLQYIVGGKFRHLVNSIKYRVINTKD